MTAQPDNTGRAPTTAGPERPALLDPMFAGAMEPGPFVEGMWAMLRTASPDQRSAASPAAILARHVLSNDPFIRRQAHYALAMLGPAGEATIPGNLRRLLLLLHHPEPATRESAVTRIGHAGVEAAAAWPAVVRILADDVVPEVRYRAAITLGQMRTAEAIPALVGALRDAETNVRARAADALGELGDAARGALPALFDAVTAEDCFLEAGEAIVKAIRRIRDGVVEA